MIAVKYSHQFVKDWKKAEKSSLGCTIQKLMELVIRNPFQNPPPYEKLKGYEHMYSRRINGQHRLVLLSSEIRLNLLVVGATTNKKG